MNSLDHFISFRKLCIENAHTALESAKTLVTANHIAYHLCTLSLEEIGKATIAWFNYCNAQKSNSEDRLLVIDEHVKKIFWAIWWPFMGQEVLTTKHLNENRSFASHIHQRRLQSLYTELGDSLPAHEKISDEELQTLLSFVTTRLEMAKTDEITNREPSEELTKFMAYSDKPEKRSFIFGEEGQKALIEKGDVKLWVKWIIEKFEKEDLELTKLLKQELGRKAEFNDEEENTKKWEIKIKVISSLHSIRPAILTDYNKTSEMFQLNKGGDNNTLIISVLLSKQVSITSLWHYGYFVCRVYVTSLNIATNGVFWWNTNVDLDKYYERIRDLECNKKVQLGLVTNLKWPESRAPLSLQHLHLSEIVNRYMLKSYNTHDFEPFQHYMHSLSLIAKNDVHLRFELDIFIILFRCYRKTIIKYQKLKEPEDYESVGFNQIKGLLAGSETYDQTMSLGNYLLNNNVPPETAVTMTHVLAIKNYLGIYLLTLAVRDFKSDDAITLVDQTD